MTALTIGDLRPDETEAAVALWEACGLTRPWNDARADIAMALEKPASTVLAGRIDGRLVATAMVGHDGHRGWLYYLAVAPDCRGHGHGQAMVRAGEAWTARTGIPKLCLMVRSDNAGVVAFYKAIGYETGDVVCLSRWVDGRQG
ncbi:MAG: GNAT family acetyltransferase [Hyphomicrobiaceae bacterium]|nr:GNAT family acetyltransferase [Hyphomicrobiaceae bacterium]